MPVVSMSMRFLIGIVQALVCPRVVKRRVHLVDELVGSVIVPGRSGRERRSTNPGTRESTSAASCATAASGFRMTTVSIIEKRRRVGGGLGAARLSEDALDLGNSRRSRVLALQQVLRLPSTEMPGASSA